MLSCYSKKKKYSFTLANYIVHTVKNFSENGRLLRWLELSYPRRMTSMTGDYKNDH